MYIGDIGSRLRNLALIIAATAVFTGAAAAGPVDDLRGATDTAPPARITVLALLDQASSTAMTGLKVWIAEAMARHAAAQPAIDATVTAAIPPVQRATPSSDELFASVPIGYARLPAIERLRPAYAEIGVKPRPCVTETCRIGRTTLAEVVSANRNAGFTKLVGAVNRSVNTLIRYRRDSDMHGVMDRWSTPSETISVGVGDCEDYAILKMAVLADAGIPMKSMSIVVLKDVRRNVFHAVLAVKTSAGSFILDNLSADVRQDAALPDYQPLYSVSAGRGFIYGRVAGPALTAANGSLSLIAPGEGVSEPELAALPDPDGQGSL